MSKEYLSQDVLFKGCTRPAMIFGIPIVPFFCAVLLFTLISIYTTLLFMIGLFPVLIIFHLIAKQDDQQFRLLYLKLKFRAAYFFGNYRFWKASAYSPLEFKSRK